MGRTLRAWHPAGLVADYAPTALLAARAAGLRRVTLGSGFSAFPAGEPMPSLRPHVAIERADLARRDTRLVTSVAQALDRAAPRAPAPQRAAELFAADAHLVCTWPPFDPFGSREGVEYLVRRTTPRARDRSTGWARPAPGSSGT
jgi:hypothetical protein